MKLLAAALAALVLATPEPLAQKTANLKFSFKNADGRKVSLSEFKGKVIILDFWATWCVPCKQEIPDFIKLQEKYGSRGLQVVGISVDDSQTMAKKYATEMKMNYPVLLAEGKDDILKAYEPVKGIPVSVVIDRKGNIAAHHEGIKALDVFEKEIVPLLE